MIHTPTQRERRLWVLPEVLSHLDAPAAAALTARAERAKDFVCLEIRAAVEGASKQEAEIFATACEDWDGMPDDVPGALAEFRRAMQELPE